MIGVTSHFVTEELDCGPIIEQMVSIILFKPQWGQNIYLLERNYVCLDHLSYIEHPEKFLFSCSLMTKVCLHMLLITTENVRLLE